MRSTTIWRTLVGTVGVVVLVWVGGDLYEIVTSGGERPAGGSGGPQPPAEGQPPTTAGPHDPSQFEHGR